MVSLKAYAPVGMIGCSGIFTILVYLLGFGGKQILSPIEMHFGMQLDATGGPAVKVWARTPLPAFIQVVMFNVSKKEEDGTMTGGVDMFELFPTGEETNYGGAWSQFSMTLIDASEEPILNTTMKMIPMVFKRNLELGRGVTFALWMVAFVINNWTMYIWGMVLTGVTVTALGVILLMGEKSKEKETLVTPIVPD